MQERILVLLTVAIPIMAATALQAQTTSELSGRVTYEDRGMPGVTVSVRSPALQGGALTATNAQGDYVIKFLPTGDYTVVFELETFKTLTYQLKITTSQPKYLDAVMYPEAVEEEIVVAAQLETVSTGTQGSETMELATLERLPVGRTIEAAVGLAAGTTATGRFGFTTISGGSYDANLYTMNGVVMNENFYNQPFSMYIEDAVLATTTMTSNLSAEYGRFAGGVVNMVTRSGGNEFSGSFRASFDNDSWNGATPLTVDQTDEVNTLFEATFGGYLWRDRLWFFLAGRDQSESRSSQIVTPGQPDEGIPYEEGSDDRRLEVKLTGAMTPSHRLMISYTNWDRYQTNLSYLAPADANAIDPHRSLPLTAWSLNYSGVLSDSFFIEALYSRRDLEWVDSGGEDPRLGATPVFDHGTGVGFNAHPFCATCPNERRSNQNFWAKASLFLSGAGTHDLVFGVDAFKNDVRQSAYQSATDYLFETMAQQDYSEPGNPYVVIAPWWSVITWNPIRDESDGNSFTTLSAYANDTWRISNRWTVNLGVRYDQNDGTDADGVKTVSDSRVSPRLSAAWDVAGDGKIILTAGASRYVEETGQKGDFGSAAGKPHILTYWYVGPAIAAGTPEYPTNSDALEAMFDWFFNVFGGTSNTSFMYDVFIPGLTWKVSDRLRSPYGDEFTLGASVRLGTRGVLRLDLVRRSYGDFYATETEPYRWAEDPEFGLVVDEIHLRNDNSYMSREYRALMGRFDYRIGSRWNLGATYTWSENWGNISSSGSLGAYAHPEYWQASWASPGGWVDTDQRHKLRAWVIWDAYSSTHHNLSMSLLQSFWSGTPYSAVSNIDTVPYVGEPIEYGYAGPIRYWPYFFSSRGAYRWDDVLRTDLALNYSFLVNIGGGQLEFFLQPEVLNIFNSAAVVAGNTTVSTANPSNALEPFDPFTTEPIEGVHWMKSPYFGEPTGERDYQQPRTFRFSVGLRF